MITLADLHRDFYPVTELEHGLARCYDKTAAKTSYYYVDVADDGVAARPFVVSDDRGDDEFARLHDAVRPGL